MTGIMDTPALDRLLESGIGIPESVADIMGLDTSDGTGATVERMLGAVDGMTGTRDASAFDRILEGGTGILESVADAMRPDTSDGTGVTTETLGTALGTIGTEVDKSTEDTKPPAFDVATETKLPTPDVTTVTKLDTSETSDEGMPGNGRAAVGVTSGVEIGCGAVSLTPVPVPATPKVTRSPLGVTIELSVTVGETSTDETSGIRDETNGITS